jgi:hypothetical protein
MTGPPDRRQCARGVQARFEEWAERHAATHASPDDVDLLMRHLGHSMDDILASASTPSASSESSEGSSMRSESLEEEEGEGDGFEGGAASAAPVAGGGIPPPTASPHKFATERTMLEAAARAARMLRVHHDALMHNTAEHAVVQVRAALCPGGALAEQPDAVLSKHASLEVAACATT